MPFCFLVTFCGIFFFFLFCTNDIVIHIGFKRRNTLFQQRHAGSFPRSMKGFVTLDEVGDEEDADHQKQYKAGLMKLAGKTEGNSAETNTEEMEQEDETYENGTKTENLKLESSEGATSTMTDEKDNTTMQENKTVHDEHRIGPYQPNVPVGKNGFLLDNIYCACAHTYKQKCWLLSQKANRCLNINLVIYVNNFCDILNV